MLSDFHLHSSFSSDSEADMKDILNKAISLNMASICITDHYDMDFPIDPVEPEMNFDLNTDAYFKYMSQLKEQYKPSIDLKIGIELGFMPETAEKLNAFVKSHPEYDFFIGSLHIIDGVDPYKKTYFEGKTEQQAYYHYFDTILEVAKLFDGYNVLGHLDYVMRYGPNKADNFLIDDYREVFHELFKLIVPMGKGIEINTGGLYKGLGYAHPHIDIFKLYRDAGGEIVTVGSDAHLPKYVGYGFDDALKKLQENGFKYYCTFDRQRPVFHKI